MSERARLTAHFAALALVFAALFAWTWGKWPDALVDFGRELYVPWQMTEGRQLFADIAWFTGPLSPRWNALAFRVFGVGLSTLVWTNAALFALLLVMLHGLVRSVASLGAATAACAVVMAVCGFGQLVGIGNYNFITPYSHEATHGVLLAVAALAATQRWAGRRSNFWVVLAGLCVGLAFLTKPEMFAAAACGTCAATLAHAWNSKHSQLRAASALALGALTPIVFAWAMQIPALGSDGAWRATLGAWPDVAANDVTTLDFYRSGMGLDVPGQRVLEVLAWGAGTLAMLLPAFAAGVWSRNARWRVPAAIAAALVTLGAFAALFTTVPWLHAARPWPLFAALSAIAWLLAARVHRGAKEWPGALGLSVFALAMLAKMVLAARLIHYGFVLALPAAALCTVWLWTWLPRALGGRIGDGLAWRAGIAALLAALCAVHLATTARIHAAKRFELGHGADRFDADLRGKFVAEALEWLEREHPSSSTTLAVFPEGVSLNYLARRANPTPYVNFMPPEMLLFGEPAILERFRAHPPDVVMLTHKSTAEYGLPWFGRDYARDLFQWITASYRPVALFGDPPLGLLLPGESPPSAPRGFGIRVFVRAP